MLPSPDILNNYPHGRFVLANLAAKRAKQLREGAMPLVHTDSHHPLTIALAEIAAGKIKPVLGKAEEVRTDDIALVADDAMAEFGMLLPALDESEIQAVEELDAEHEEEEVREIGLTDLLEEDLTEAAPVSDDDTLSLTDIAEQESAEEGESEE